MSELERVGIVSGLIGLAMGLIVAAWVLGAGSAKGRADEQIEYEKALERAEAAKHP